MENSIQTGTYTMGWEFKRYEKLMPNSQLRCETLYLQQYMVITIFVTLYSVLYFPVTAAASAWLEGFHLIQRKGATPKRREITEVIWGWDRGGAPYLLISIIICQIPEVPCALSLLWGEPQNVDTQIHIIYIHICMRLYILVFVCGLFFRGFLLSGGVYTAQTSQ